MPTLKVNETQLTNQNVEKKRLPQSYFVSKSPNGKSEQDCQLLDSIWSFLKSVEKLDISEIEVDVEDRKVDLFGTFTDAQLQGQVVHGIMNIDGVDEVHNQTRILTKHPVSDFPKNDSSSGLEPEGEF